MFADSLWILKQWAENELESSGSHTERQAARRTGQLSFCP
jgi:hypothetical protein